MRSYKDKTVLITGAAAGIGFCTAQEFAKDGASLILTDINEEALETAAQKLRETGAEVHTYVNDVTDRADVQRVAGEVLEKFGGLDVLINNAGIGLSKELKDTTFEDWQRLLAINMWGPLNFVYAFLPSMLQRQSGQITNVSSGQAFFRMPTWGAYSAVKLCVACFSEVLYYELFEYGIRVTTVYPYMVNTGFYDDVQGESFGTKMAMKLLPYYSQTPEKVGKIIFKAVKKKKRVEMVSLMNRIGNLKNFVPLADQGISLFTNWLMASHAQKIQNDE